MFASVRFIRSRLRSIDSAVRIAPVRPFCQAQTLRDEPQNIEEFFVTSAFLDFGGVPTELLRWHELQQRRCCRPARPERLWQFCCCV